jgi:hypothetical protein
VPRRRVGDENKMDESPNKKWMRVQIKNGDLFFNNEYQQQ